MYPKLRHEDKYLFATILTQLKNYIRQNRYIITLHAEEEMNEDELSIFDVEHAILTGSIIERQKDAARTEWKYIVRGQSIEGSAVVVVTKISTTGKMAIITVFRDE